MVFGMFLDVVQSVQSSNNILPLVIFLNSWRESLSDTFTSISIGPTTMPLSKKCGDLSDLHEREPFGLAKLQSNLRYGELLAAQKQMEAWTAMLSELKQQVQVNTECANLG